MTTIDAEILESLPFDRADLDPIAIRIAGAELLASNFLARPLLKAFPGARWDRGRKGWVIPTARLAELKAWLKVWPAGVAVTIEQPPKPPPPPARPGPKSWADQMFASIPPELHRRVHRALAGVLHPDHGGDHKAMAELSAARDRSTS